MRVSCRDNSRDDGVRLSMAPRVPFGPWPAALADLQDLARVPGGRRRHARYEVTRGAARVTLFLSPIRLLHLSLLHSLTLPVISPTNKPNLPNPESSNRRQSAAPCRAHLEARSPPAVVFARVRQIDFFSLSAGIQGTLTARVKSQQSSRTFFPSNTEM